VDIPEYNKVAAVLKQCEGLSDVSESHGTLTGLLAAAPDADWRGKWLQLTIHAGDSGEAVSLPASSRPVLDALYDGTQAALSGLNMGFYPLLPDDSTTAAERAAALGQWCQGFLYGFSMARPGSHDGLPPQVREVLDDMSRLAQVEVPEEEGSEQDEAALMEIVEYLRVAAQLIHDELKLMEPSSMNQTRH